MVVGLAEGLVLLDENVVAILQFLYQDFKVDAIFVSRVFSLAQPKQLFNFSRLLNQLPILLAQVLHLVCQRQDLFICLILVKVSLHILLHHVRPIQAPKPLYLSIPHHHAFLHLSELPLQSPLLLVQGNSLLFELGDALVGHF